MVSWGKIGGKGINNSWNSKNFWINRDLVSNGTNLYATIGGGSSEKPIGSLWKNNGKIWERYSIALESEIIINRPRLFISNDIVYICYIDEFNNIKIVNFEHNEEISINLNDFASSDLQKIDLHFFSIVNKIFYLGLSESNIATPHVIRSDGHHHENLVSPQFSGSDEFRSATGSPYSICPYQDGIAVGTYNKPDHAKPTGSVWHFSERAGWVLLGGFGVAGSWTAGATTGVLTLLSKESLLFATLYRMNGTLDAFSSVWKYDGTAWNGFLPGNTDATLTKAIHYNSSCFWKGHYLVGVGSNYSNRAWSNNTGVWMYSFAAEHWSKIFDPLALSDSEQGDMAIPQSRGQYIYAMTPHRDSIVIGLTSWKQEGQSTIWRSIPDGI